MQTAILFPSKHIWENKLVVYSMNIRERVTMKHASIHTRFHLTEQPHVNIPQCENGRLELKATVNSRAPWPRHGPQGIGEVYQCWWCLAVTEPDWQLLSVCPLSVICSSHVPTPCLNQAPTTWLCAGHIYSLDHRQLRHVYVCVWKEYKNIPPKGIFVNAGIWLKCRSKITIWIRNNAPQMSQFWSIKQWKIIY